MLVRTEICAHCGDLVTIHQPLEAPEDQDFLGATYLSPMVRCPKPFCRGVTEAGTGRKITRVPLVFFDDSAIRAQRLRMGVARLVPVAGNLRCSGCNDMIVASGRPIEINPEQWDVFLCGECLTMTEVRTGRIVTMQSRRRPGRILDIRQIADIPTVSP